MNWNIDAVTADDIERFRQQRDDLYKAANRFLESIGHVPGIEAERRAFIAELERIKG